MIDSTIDSKIVNGIDLSREACDQRLWDALSFLTDHPEHWNQRTWGLAPRGSEGVIRDGGWPCGTVACLGGTAAIQAGLVQTMESVVDDELLLHLNAQGRALITAVTGHNLLSDYFSFTDLGAVLFGLDITQAEELFDFTNNLSEMWKLADEFTDGRVHLPEGMEGRVAEIDVQVLIKQAKELR